jgi:hypothetical protein
MILQMDSSQEETFRLLTHYFAVRREEILVSNPPSYVKAKVPTDLSPLVADCKAEANITKKNGGSYVNINFDFRRAYAESFAVVVFLSVVLFVVPVFSSPVTYFTSTNYYGLGAAFTAILALVIVVMALEGYIFSLTKKRLINELRLINEFIKFAQPLPPPPDS